MTPPETFTNRELGMMLQEMKENTHTTLERIEEKVDKTNGRVKRLELWRMVLIGAWAAITFMLPLLTYLFISSVSNFKTDIKQEINMAIQDNNNKYLSIPGINK